MWQYIRWQTVGVSDSGRDAFAYVIERCRFTGRYRVQIQNLSEQ